MTFNRARATHFSRVAAVPSTRCLSFSGAVEGLFLLSTDPPSPNPPKRHCGMKAVRFGVGPPTETYMEPYKSHVYLVGSSAVGHSHLTLHFEVCKDVVLPQWKLEVCVCPLMRSPYYKGSRIVHRERAERHVGPGIGKGNNFMDTSLSSLPYQVRCCFLECRDKMSCIAEGPVIQHNLGFQGCAANEVTAVQGDQWMCVDKVGGSCWPSL